MIVRRLDELTGTDRETRAETWASRRFLLKEDGMGFSLHDTIIHAGTSTEMHYQNHLEAVYCIEGKGVLKFSQRTTMASSSRPYCTRCREKF